MAKKLPAGIVEKDGRYRIMFRSRNTEPGRRFTERLPEGTRQREAEAVLRQRRSADLLGELEWKSDKISGKKSPDFWTFGEFVKEVYLPHVESSLRTSTLKRYKRELATISPWFWDEPLAGIDAPMVARFAAERKGESVRARTVNIGIQQVRHVLNVAHELLYLSYPPPRFKKLPEKDKRPVEYLTYEQADLVVEASRRTGGPWPALVLFCLHTGSRFNEARNLRWKHLDLDGGLVHFYGAETKSGKSRSVGLLPEVAEALDNLPRRSDYVFTVENWSRVAGEKGKKIDQIPNYATSGRKHFPWDPPGLRVNPHMFRHTCAAWLLRSGWGMEKVQAVLGHASVQLTIDIYGHIKPEEHTAEMASMYRPGRRAPRLKVIDGGGK